MNDFNIPDDPCINQNAELFKGLSNEDKVFKYLKDNKYKDLKKYKDYWSPFDFYTDKVLVEVKSRNNTHNKYETTIVGYNKIQISRKSNKKGRFYFLFTDGLYLWRHSTNYTKGYGGRQTNKTYAYIKYEDLTFITDTINSL